MIYSLYCTIAKQANWGDEFISETDVELEKKKSS